MAEPAEGAVPAGDFTPVVDDVVVEDPDHVSDLDEVASEVLAGHWGRGRARDEKLAAAGHDVAAVNAAIAERLGL